MADVFVSYHKKDRERAEQAVASLSAHGYSVWWDDRVTPMESWDKTVEREIDAARCVLVLWTKESVESDWVRIEANFAKMAHPRKLVQVRLEECRIPMNFSMIQYIDALDTNFDPVSDEGWEKALEWVGLFAGAAPVSAEPPPPPPKPRKRKTRKAKAPTAEPAVADQTPPPPEPPPPPPMAERVEQPSAIHAFTAPPPPPRPPAAPPPRPSVDYEAAFRRAFSGVTSRAERLVTTGGYWRRGLILAAVGSLVGTLVSIWFVSEALYADNGTLYITAGAILMRACAAGAVAVALVSSGRLVLQRALILVAAFAAITLIYNLMRMLLIDVAPQGTRSFLSDLVAIGLVWLIARQLGALRGRTDWRWPIVTSAALGAFALLYGIALANGVGPTDSDIAAQSLTFGSYLFLECCLVLALFEPTRQAPGRAVQIPVK